MKLRVFCLCLALLTLSACASSPATSTAPAPSVMPTPALTAAESFIGEADTAELDSIVGGATLLAWSRPSFHSVEELSSRDFFNFFVCRNVEIMTACYSKSDETFLVPVKEINSYLERYFDFSGFESKNYGERYDEERGIITVRAYGASWSMLSTVEDVQAISDELVQIGSVFYNYREKPSAASPRMLVTIK